VEAGPGSLWPIEFVIGAAGGRIVYRNDWISFAMIPSGDPDRGYLKLAPCGWPKVDRAPREKTGTAAPEGMPNPHVHHIVFKEGLPGTQRALVEAAQDILRRRAGIDPVYSSENLIWAPNIKASTRPRLPNSLLTSFAQLTRPTGRRRILLPPLRRLGEQAAARR
jgi:hypothetical protein